MAATQLENSLPKGLNPADPAALPDFIIGATKKSKEKLKVRYQKLNMDEFGDIAELEKIETKALQGDQDVYVISKKEFIFMDKVFVLIGYLEPADPSDQPTTSGLSSMNF